MLHARLWLVAAVILLVVATCSGLVATLPVPVNPVWHIFNGYYQYDPRQVTPPSGLLRDRPEESLQYYLNATLAACNGRYPPASNDPVQHYTIESVEYFGKTNYHAVSHLHTRLFLGGGTSVQVTFAFQAGADQSALWGFGSRYGAGAWMALGGLVEAADTPPPRVPIVVPNNNPTTCAGVTRPFAIGAWEHQAK